MPDAPAGYRLPGGRINATPEVFILLLKGGGVTSYLSGEAVQTYEKALALGKKEGQKLPALETVLAEERIFSPKEMPLGQVQIPLELIVGTKMESRGNSFSKSFYPLMELHTEFSDKWIRLYQTHLDEGIHDPILAYEYMNRFYVVEGNKRVSILKYLKAATIQGNVIRIIPPLTGEKQKRIYYEFMDFYRLSEINYIWFSKEGSFSRLQKLTRFGAIRTKSTLILFIPVSAMNFGRRAGTTCPSQQGTRSSLFWRFMTMRIWSAWGWQSCGRKSRSHGRNFSF